MTYSRLKNHIKNFKKTFRIHDKFEKYTDLPEVMKFLLVPPK